MDRSLMENFFNKISLLAFVMLIFSENNMAMDSAESDDQFIEKNISENKNRVRFDQVVSVIGSQDAQELPVEKQGSAVLGYQNEDYFSGKDKQNFSKFKSVQPIVSRAGASRHLFKAEDKAYRSLEIPPLDGRSPEEKRDFFREELQILREELQDYLLTHADPTRRDTRYLKAVRDEISLKEIDIEVLEFFLAEETIEKEDQEPEDINPAKFPRTK